MDTTILRKRTSQGQTVEVRLHENAPGWYVVQVYVNGQFVPGPTQPIEMDPPEGGYTHYLGGGYGDRPIVGLTEVEAEVVMRALGKAQRDTKFRQTGERRVLEARRKDLMMDYRRLVQRQQAEYEAAVAAGRPDAEQISRAYEPRLRAAEQAIKEFDRAHPDIVESVVKGLEPDAE
ncbi:MAG: hypothetical protein ACOYEW_01960 [Anaerolineae bacterium]